jgi:hypothetical protein
MTTQHFKAASFSIWAGLLAVAFLTAPPAAADTTEQIVKMVSGRLDGINISLFGLFNLMGVWPAVMTVLLRFDTSKWKWPFIAGSFALGAFALLPWFALRPWLSVRVEPASRFGRFLGNRWLHRALAFAGLCFAGLFAFGDMKTFVTLFQTQQFPYVMSFDFVAMTLASVLLVIERAQTSRAALTR